MTIQPSASWRLLLVDDDYDDYIIFKDYLADAQGIKVSLDWASSYRDGEQRLNTNTYDAVFVDYYLGPETGIRLIREMVARGYPAPMILLTGQGSYRVDLEAMDAGATFYLTKDEITPLSLERFIRYAIERKRVEDALTTSETKYRGLAESIQDSLIEIDRNWCFLYLNQRAGDNFGFNSQDLIGKNLWETFPSILGTPIEQSYRQVMEQREPASFELPGKGPDQWHLIRVYPSTDGILIFWIDITQSKKAEAELREQTIQIELHHRLSEHREQERLRITRELHDGPIQDLLVLLMNIRFKQGLAADLNTKNELTLLEEGLQSAVQSMRDMINEIRPPNLIRFGLAKAIRFYLEDFQCKHPEIVLASTIMDEDIPLSEHARLCIFRILQEALTNIIKHSNAKRVEVCWLQEGHLAALKIRDEGWGFQVPDNLLDYSSCGHYGLLGMRERAEVIGGQLSIQSQPGKGTTTRLFIPILEPAEAGR